MAFYTLSVRTINAAIASCAELRTTTTDRIYLLEVGITINAATASVFGLGRPAAIGVTPTGPTVGLAEDLGDPAATGTVATAWATAPTAPAQFFRRVSLPATVGAGIVWVFRRLVINVSSSVVLYNITANSVADVWFVWDE
jgi:hypothetical protein